ncbi:undecaprenyl/decaprenyl-phosphate alpha-N-acetylglucosaminyl 1-phosphate transferase [bacterium]|nr:undecaprenyl/decaprenyl-phosphate alpha-N-acetylglucosaminyl 1-phosphate transferase [bacterium]NCQ55085.1 undecaprenyl/decaprenyl-phosphate alpha-N-acetylglucosaminyl 1-phosphate transferase [Candidatus Parcubacteria bacterium]NCS67129.1 undecaprenyl/decaprenyl-phosphate alpha-N-acetylglucosaminyl 1-phosphate transferase [Candidatus Peregrinibacteria bacterium]NCS96075.1 undecaprenyl/decaprenyl-phosphate alpha-N-acetylglucosaminyl 1-phosphate transferase [bacterium]
MDSILIALASGLGLGAVATWLSLKVWPKLGWLDFPERYGLTRERLPYPGGIVFWILSVVGVWMIEPLRPLIIPILILGFVSYKDDRKALPAWLRLMVHFWIALFLVFQGVQIYYVSNPFADTNFALAETIPFLAVLLTVGWIVAIQNAMNWFDGLPGLNVGISGVGFLTLALLGVVRPELWFDPNHFNLTLINFYLAALCAGAFWWYWKGKIILGDTGSQLLGWLLAVMAIFSGAKIATTLLVLSLPLLDFGWVIFRRVWLEKKSPFKGDLFHLHHLLAARAKDSRVTLYLVGGSLLLGLAAVFLPSEAKLPSFAAIALAVTIVNWRLWSRRKAN